MILTVNDLRDALKGVKGDVPLAALFEGCLWMIQDADEWESGGAVFVIDVGPDRFSRNYKTEEEE